MVKKEAPIGLFQLTNQLEPEHWEGIYKAIDNAEISNDEKIRRKDEFTALLAAVKSGDRSALERLGVMLTSILNSNNMPPIDMNLILHDKDTRSVWDDTQMRETMELKMIHLHIVSRLSKAAMAADIAKACGVHPNMIEKPKSGRYSYENQLAYLIHAKHKDKYQYSPQSVVTIDNSGVTNVKAKPYTEIYAENHTTWERAAAKAGKKTSKQDADRLVEMILDGKLTYHQVMMTNEYYNIYSYNMRRCDDAFAAYEKRKECKNTQALNNGEFKRSVIFITGKSGSGKTRCAKQFMDTLIKQVREEFGENWNVCPTAATNPIDDYRGEEILFMDDVRGNAMISNDWLKLLDPYNATQSSARYRNKTVTSRVIIVTSEKNPFEFFYFVKGNGNERSEAMDQHIRRIMALVQVVCKDEEPRFVISTSEKGGERVVKIGEQEVADGRYHKDITVTMNYGFVNEHEVSAEDGISELLDMVMNNNRKPVKSGDKSEVG